MIRISQGYIVICALIIVASIGHVQAQYYGDVPDDISEFLKHDLTNERKYNIFYNCGHFSRDLSNNASKVNISIGSAILSNHPVFRGYNNHIINYVEINNTLYFIEPQTDKIMLIDEIFMEYKYIRLYPDGTKVPSFWIRKLAPTIRYEDGVN